MSGHAAKREASPPQRHYGRFYWPLALSGYALLLEHQIQNGVLAQYPRAELELSTFALASSSFQLVNRFNLHIHIHWQLLMGMSILKKTLIVACFYRENILYPSSFSFLSQEVDAV